MAIPFVQPGEMKQHKQAAGRVVPPYILSQSKTKFFGLQQIAFVGRDDLGAPFTQADVKG